MAAPRLTFGLPALELGTGGGALFCPDTESGLSEEEEVGRRCCSELPEPRKPSVWGGRGLGLLISGV